MNVGQNIKEFRKLRGMTQLELAVKADISSQVISNIERNYSQPKQSQLENLAKVLNCQISDLIVENDVDYEKIMFSDKKAFDALPKNEKRRILNNLQEQADFMIERAKQNNQ
ncbi:helix-turn-helix domain-containing protein [Staphylococcus capitis]|uniref:helix-turn-helix domain-containing protein n=1 Tax=Staphylococcus capitis TaxID=29388 RepID=UPI00145B2FC8|nr:helix-turn-helix transcriptional regulator [Staphylococcus capitis]NMK90635.1 helix-turn-helix transcriptional regulator [Staphylococcus capitis]NMK92027.1 helix-turn-helix transcriptional regulator [Staphylococcus capitis]